MWTVAKYLGVLALGFLGGAGVVIFGGEGMRKRIASAMHSAEKLIGGGAK